jgi:hypothetical protein
MRQRKRCSSTWKNRRNHRQKKRIISGSLFVNRTSPSVFEPSPRVQGDSRDEERLLAQRPDPYRSLAVQVFDLAELRLVRRVWASMRPTQPEGRGEGDVANPDRDRRLRDAEGLGDVGEGAVLARNARAFACSLTLPR